MRYNSVVSGYPKSTGVSWVDGLVNGPLSFEASHFMHIKKTATKQGFMLKYSYQTRPYAPKKQLPNKQGPHTPKKTATKHSLMHLKNIYQIRPYTPK